MLHIMTPFPECRVILEVNSEIHTGISRVGDAPRHGDPVAEGEGEVGVVVGRGGGVNVDGRLRRSAARGILWGPICV